MDTCSHMSNADVITWCITLMFGSVTPVPCLVRAKEVSPEWSDVSVEDILYERTELVRRINGLSAMVDQVSQMGSPQHFA